MYTNKIKFVLFSWASAIKTIPPITNLSSCFRQILSVSLPDGLSPPISFSSFTYSLTEYDYCIPRAWFATIRLLLATSLTYIVQLRLPGSLELNLKFSTLRNLMGCLVIKDKAIYFSENFFPKG